MNLFVNTISNPCSLILFDDNRSILNQKEFEIKGNESSLLIPAIDDFLGKNNLSYFDIKNIVLVNGPGSFTGVRTSVLAINTINYITKNNLTAIDFFNLYKNYPIVKSSSKRDCFVKMGENSKIEIIENDKLENIIKEKEIKKIYGEASLENVQIIEKIDYLGIIKKIVFQKNKKIEPLYLKKPNIS